MTGSLPRTIVRIREMILSGQFAPAQRVAERRLAAFLGVSRTPIRQALPVLAQEGLLERHEKRGYVVRAFTDADFADAVEVHCLIEGLAARRAAEHLVSKSFLRKLRSCLTEADLILNRGHLGPLDIENYHRINGRFHALIDAQAGSTVFHNALRRSLRTLSLRVSRHPAAAQTPVQVLAMLRNAHEQHREIVAAFAGGDSGRVETLMWEHAHSIVEIVDSPRIQTVEPH